MGFLSVFRQEKLKSHYISFFCASFIASIVSEVTVVAAELSQSYYEQVNDRLNRLENKTEDLNECYIRVKDIQKDVEMIKKSMRESTAIKEKKTGISGRLETSVDKRVKSLQEYEETSPGTPAQEEKPEVRERLESRVEKLEETVQDLTGRAALMDTAEEIRRMTEYVCPNGHSFETMNADGK